MTPLSNNAGNGNQQTAAQNAVTLCAVTNSADPVTDINYYLPGWKIVWDGIQTPEGNYAFIAVDPAEENYALAIRGSLSGKIFGNWDVFSNWVLEDFDVLTQVSWRYATTSTPKISNGANIAFNNLLKMQDSLGSGLSIKDYLLTNAVKPGKQVIITGHSLGGNIANVYTSYFITTITEAKYSSGNVSLYTFAAPAPGNGDFATDLDAKLPTAWHYQSINDAIPNFPVADNVFQLGNKYQPKPVASAIIFTNDGNTISLRDGLIILSGILTLCGYKQQANNYKIFPTDLNKSFVDNTVKDWLSQAGSQHQISNYATYLDVELPQQVDQLV